MAFQNFSSALSLVRLSVCHHALCELMHEKQKGQSGAQLYLHTTVKHNAVQRTP